MRDEIFSCKPYIADLEKLPAQMLPRVAEHGHAQIVVQAQQDVRKHPPVRTTWIRARMYVGTVQHRSAYRKIESIGCL